MQIYLVSVEERDRKLKQLNLSLPSVFCCEIVDFVVFYANVKTIPVRFIGHSRRHSPLLATPLMMWQ